MTDNLNFKLIKPEQNLSAFVDSFWMLHNLSGSEKQVVILPDGRIDLFFSVSDNERFHVSLSGIGTHPEQSAIAPGALTFAISFKLPAIEYVLHQPIADLLNSARELAPGFWNFAAEDLQDFDTFCRKAAVKISSLLPRTFDLRKQRLFEAIYNSQGSLGISELAGKAAWSSRQINRYFTQQYGLSLKAYCSILRFRASFQDIKDGKLFPEGHFADQSHFIKEVRKLAGAIPKELNRNQNDRFIQFSTLPRK